jgi:succinyl-CoA synthetase beta subunit
VKVPIVVRLTGTNEVEAVEILRGIGMTALSDMDEAVQKVVALTRGAA